jgi:hypothetical protein
MPPYDPRDDITNQLMQRQGASPLDYGMAGLGSAAPAASPMTGPTLPGLPATPPGGVPGAGIAPAGPSVLPTPPRPAMQGGMMPGIGSLGAGMGQMGQVRGAGMGQMSDFESRLGRGQMSDFESRLGRMGGRQRGY